MIGVRSGAARLLRWVVARLRVLTGFLRHFVWRFFADRGPQVASELSYTTLLSIVPLMAVVFGLMAAYPIFGDMREQLQGFVFDNFVPAAGQVIQRNLLTFADNATRISGVGAVFLFVTALLMMATIDRSFNAIWQVTDKRNLWSNFTVYWAVLTLVPLLLGASVLVSAELQALPWYPDAAKTIEQSPFKISLMPFLGSTMAFFLLYMVVPNRRVPIHHALSGALVAALLFEVAKRGFHLYISSFHTYTLIYGTLATLPIFLVWLFVSWVVALLGAEFTRALSTYKAAILTHRWGGAGGDFVYVYRLLGHLWQAQLHGRALSTKALLDLEPALSEDSLRELLDECRRCQLIIEGRDRRWSLARDIGELTLADLHRLLPYSVRVVAPSSDPWDQQLHEVLERAVGQLQRQLQVPLKRLYQGPAKPFASPGDDHA